MAQVKIPALFFVTSPRSPFKMRPEIDLLAREFGGLKWTANTSLQKSFMVRLAQLPEFEGSYDQNDPALSARDRITRGPKALGLVDLSSISLTPAGKNFLDDDLAEEALLRQLLKFQLPSPFHTANATISKSFCVRPYLEILRLIHQLGRLAFDELCLFGMQLTDWHEFDAIVEAVRQFRIGKAKNKGKYKRFFHAERERVVSEVFAKEIAEGRIRTRESVCADVHEFVTKKARNMRDYADACVRYLRGTGLVTIGNPGRTISIMESRRDEVAYILKTVDRDPVFVTDEAAYCRHLYSAYVPPLLTDDRRTLERKAVACAAVESAAQVGRLDVAELKRRIRRAQESRRRAVVDAQTTELKTFAKYDEVVAVFRDIKSKNVYDAPLALEWNVWRAMTMMDGGRIHANFAFDDVGNPLSTAPGNNADMVCDYGDFIVAVEVTLMSGSRQYDAEGEPVARHLGALKENAGKPAYCLFVAPTINPSVVSHFYGLHRISIRHYGGKSVIIPLTLDRFVGMLAQARNCGYVPSPDKVRAFCEYSMTAANMAEDEEAWYAAVSRKADSWLE